MRHHDSDVRSIARHGLTPDDLWALLLAAYLAAGADRWIRFRSPARLLTVSSVVPTSERIVVSIPAVDGRCGECGFDYGAFDTALLVTQLGSIHQAFESLLLEVGDEDLRRRPAEDVWSALEYCCHVRDVLRVQRERLTRTLAEDRPVFPRAVMWQWAEREGYNSQSLVKVLEDLRVNATAMAATLQDVTPDQLDRTLVYSYPEPRERTARWLIRHTAHENQHHLFDIGRIIGGRE